MRNHIKRAVGIAVAAALILSCLPVGAQNRLLADIGFNDAETNAASPFVSVDGSANCRVVEDGTVNKAYFIDTANVDNIVDISLTAVPADKRYFVQFDIKTVGTPPAGTVSLKDAANKELKLFSIGENGIIYSTDGKKIGGIGGGSYVVLGAKVDIDFGFVTIYVNGRAVLDRWKISGDPILASRLSMYFEAAGSGSGVYLDRIRMYEGERYSDAKTEYVYNPKEADFTYVEEGEKADSIYLNDNLDDVNEMPFEKVPKANKIYNVFNEKEQNGYVEISKTTDDDVFLNRLMQQTSKNIVLEADFRYIDSLPQTCLFMLRDTITNSNIEQLWLVTASDGSINAGGTSVSMKSGIWYKVSLVLNIRKSLYSVYVNDRLLTKDKSFSSNFKTLSLWRIYVEAGGSRGNLQVDNIKVYDGTEPRDISNEKVEEASKFSNDEALTLLKNKTALQMYSSKLYANNIKQDTDIPCVTFDDDALVSSATFELLYNQKVTVNGDTIRIGSAEMKKDVSEITVGTNSIPISVAPKEINGELMIPVAAYGKYALEGKSFYDDGHGMIVVSDNEINPNDSRVKEANLYLFFDRKDAETLKEEFLEKNDGGNLHPRIMAKAEDFERLKKEVVTDTYKKKWFETVKTTADELLDEAPLTRVISGGRLLFVSEEVMERIKALALTYQLTGDDKYAKRCYDELESVCSFSDWNPEHFLDIGVMASAVAIGYDWIYNYMTPEQRKTVADGAIKNGLRPARQAYYGRASFDTFWINTETNWGIITNGGISNLALALAEDDIDFCMDVLRNALCAVEKTWYYFAPDGAWHEGTNYWKLMGWNLGIFMSSYETAMGEPFGAQYMGLDKYGMFQAYFTDPRGIVNNYHDAYEQGIMDSVQFYLAKVYNQPALMKHRLYEMEAYDVQPEVFDILYYDVNAASSDSTLDLELDKYYRDVEFVSLRENWNDPGALWVSAHGGKTNSAHNHIDEGSFVFDIGNYRWAIDLGSDTYSYNMGENNPALLAGWTDKYYYRKKGEGHNIVVINPSTELETDITQFAKMTPPVSGENAAFTTIDLSAHYSKYADSYIRGYMIADGRRSFTVRDEIQLRSQSELYWFMHTRGEAVILDNNTALIFAQGKQLKVQFLTDAPESELSVMKAEKLPQSPKFTEDLNEGVTKLALKLKANGNVNITVKMSLGGEEPSKTPPADTPISQWSVEDAADCDYSYSTASIDSIELGGNAVYGFAPTAYNYNYSMDEDGNIPEIKVTSAYRTEIIYYDCFDGSKLAEIRAYDDSGRFNSYTVKFKPYQKMTVGEYTRHQVVGAAVSSEQEGNERGGSFDANMGTRWSALGKGEWIIHDLGSVKEIDAVGVALWMGGERNFTYDIFASEDGENFTKLFSHVSSGRDEEIEVVKLDKRVKARFIKYVGYGNTVNDWNNVIELAALKLK